jgi:hypothetical protein
MFSLRFRERTHGSMHLHASPLEVVPVRANFDFSFSLVPEALEKKTLSLSGSIDIGGIASDRPHDGAVLVHWGNEQRIRYELSFVGDDGEHYRVVGQKDFMLIAPVRSLTTLPFTLYRGEKLVEIGDGTVTLDAKKELGPTLKSIRLGFGT